MTETQHNENKVSVPSLDPNTQKDKQAYLDSLINTYDKIFEMERFQEHALNLVATAHYMESAKKGFLRAERHEHVFLFDLTALDSDTFTEIRDWVLETGVEKINPTKGYLSTFLTAVILTGSVADEVRPLIAGYSKMLKLRRQKKGYVNQRICIVDFSDHSVLSNKDAKELGDFLQNFFTLAAQTEQPDATKTTATEEAADLSVEKITEEATAETLSEETPAEGTTAEKSNS